MTEEMAIAEGKPSYAELYLSYFKVAKELLHCKGDEMHDLVQLISGTRGSRFVTSKTFKELKESYLAWRVAFRAISPFQAEELKASQVLLFWELYEEGLKLNADFQTFVRRNVDLYIVVRQSRKNRIHFL